MAHTPLIQRLQQLTSQKLSRRKMLQWSLATGATLWAAPHICGRSRRVGVIGGGAAGLAAAYWLHKNHIPWEIFESSSRIGGRIFTFPLGNKDHQFVELGGELLNTVDQETLWLADALYKEQNEALKKGKQITPQDLRVLKFKDHETNTQLHSTLFHVDGRWISESQFINSIKSLTQHLAQKNQEIFKSLKPNENYTYNISSLHPIIKKVDQTSLSEFMESLKDYAEPWSLNILLSAYEAEFGLPAQELSALNFLQMFDTDFSDGFNMYGESDEALRLGGGNSALTQALIHSLCDYDLRNKEKNIHLDQSLVALSQKGSHLVTHFASGRTEEFSHLIITIPISQLKKVDGWKKMDLSPIKMKWIENLVMGQNSKCMSGFKTRFWRELPLHENRGCQGEIYLAPGSSIIWETSRLQSGDAGILTFYSTGKQAQETGTPQDTTEKQLNSLLGSHYEKEKDAHVLFFNWPRHPLTEGSFSSLKVGQFSEFWGSGEEPECHNRLFFAGEHTSVKSQGFINGGYESGLRAAKQVLANSF